MNGLKSFLNFWGFYHEKTPEPAGVILEEFKGQILDYYICPICGDKITCRSNYEQHIGKRHDVKNGFEW